MADHQKIKNDKHQSLPHTATTSLKQAFNISPKEVISLVGAGGKTTLMFALARELSSDKGCVITTTTTKILEPLPSESPFLLMAKDEEVLLKLFLQNAGRYKHISLAREKLASGKLDGISPELVMKLSNLVQVLYVIIEADGANCRPLKTANATEPVIPDNTSLVIPLVGIDAIGCPLNDEYVFRSEIASRLLRVPLGTVMSAELVASLITQPQGIIKGSPSGARVVPFINKMDLDKRLLKGRDLASKILAARHPQITKVVLGQAQFAEPVTKVMVRVTK
ncbi:selenium cofactor biosynthesis protein YqeC [Chloroflexota bacterium]